MDRWIKIGPIIAILVSTVWACGYNFAGSGSLPAGVTQVFITVFENRSSEAGVESIFTNDLINEFTRRRKESLARDQSSADSVLFGEISAINVENISRATVSTATERRLTATLRLRLESPDQRILWQSGAIVERQTYPVAAGDRIATDLNKSVAIEAVSRKIAESAFNRMTEDF